MFIENVKFFSLCNEWNIRVKLIIYIYSVNILLSRQGYNPIFQQWKSTEKFSRRAIFIVSTLISKRNVIVFNQYLSFQTFIQLN